MDSFKFIAIGLMAIAMMGTAIGVGNIFSSLLNGLARNPSASKELVKNAFIGAGFTEAMGLFAFLIALLLIWM